MKFYRYTLEDCHEATGVVVVIDVLRAFTTAAFAFARGASQIALVSTVEEALALREAQPDVLLLGEVGGRPIDGFDYGNSPAALRSVDLTGRALVQRTSAGTQGVVLSQQAEVLLTASFPVARATAVAIRQLAPERVSFVITGEQPDRQAAEDAALADYLEAVLARGPVDAAPYLQQVRESHHGRLFASSRQPDFPAADLACAIMLDQFDFAMRVTLKAGRRLLYPVRS